MAELLDPELIDTGGELFRQTDARFKYWYADAYGIQPSFDIRSYKDMSIGEALEIARELIEVVEFCSRLTTNFPDVHDA